MSSPDLHPDELLDKDARGLLSATERTSLDDHLVRCAVCRFEKRVRADFAGDHEGADAAFDVNLLVARALGVTQTAAPRATPALAAEAVTAATAILAPAVVPGAVSPVAPVAPVAPMAPVALPRRRRRTAPILFAALASAMTIAGAAVAGRWTGVWPSAPEEVSAPAEIVTAAVNRSPRGVMPGRGAAPRTIPDEIPAPEPMIAAPVIAAPVAAPVRSRLSVAPSARPALPGDGVKTDAAELFTQANRARVAGQHAGAVRLYGELLTRFPGSPETCLSHATLGRLLLDDGDARGAKDQLDAYLSSGDLTLREEAMANRAMALGRLGRSGEEAAAWSSLLDSYPQSIHGARARARIGELGPR